jgi:hypothetical protein
MQSDALLVWPASPVRLAKTGVEDAAWGGAATRAVATAQRGA